MPRPVVYEEPRVNVGLRLDRKLHGRVQRRARAASRREGRSVSFNEVVTRALEAYLRPAPSRYHEPPDPTGGFG